MSREIPPLLSEIFKADPHCLTYSPQKATLGTLSNTLNTTIAKLESLIREGYLATDSRPPYSSQTWVQMPSQKSLRWLRGWFTPARTKAIFSVEDLAALLEIPTDAVMELAGANEIELNYETAFGPMFSAWAAKRVVLSALRGTPEAQDAPRFDRQAILWWILSEDPLRASRMAPFDERLEDEIARVASMEEPTRTIRAAALIDQIRDACKIAESAKVEVPQEKSQKLESLLEELAG